MMIGLVGGVIGILVALIAGAIMTYAMDWEVSFGVHPFPRRAHAGRGRG